MWPVASHAKLFPLAFSKSKADEEIDGAHHQLKNSGTRKLRPRGRN